MRNNQTIVNVNENNYFSILADNKNGFEFYELAHFENADISYKYMKDVMRFHTMSEVEKHIADVTSEIVAEFFDGKAEVDEQAYMEMWTYTVWVAVTCENGKVSYDISTIHQENYENDKENQLGLNCQERKTWKGLTNYINRFDV